MNFQISSKHLALTSRPCSREIIPSSRMVKYLQECGDQFYDPCREWVTDFDFKLAASIENIYSSLVSKNWERLRKKCISWIEHLLVGYILFLALLHL